MEAFERVLGCGLGELFQIALAESFPLGGTGVIPAAQIVRWGQVAEPFVNGGAVFGEAAWPQAVDQDALTIASRGWFVDSLDGNWHRSVLHYYCKSAWDAGFEVIDGLSWGG